MTKIALIHLDSGRHDKARFERDRREFLAPLRQEFDLVAARPGHKIEADLEVVFIASGGSEQKFRLLYGGRKEPVILLADGQHNSLPAAMEISSWVRQQGGQAEIVHGSARLMVDRLRTLALFQRVRGILAGRIGVIGEPSDWLIASAVDRAAVGSRWRTEFVDIGLAEVTGHAAAAAAAAASADEFIKQAKELVGVDRKAVLAAAQLVPGLKAVFVRHGLRAATLRCFSLIETMHTSGCLALAQLNDEGLVCGCEGDLPAVFSMLLANALTGEFSFMANPAAVDRENNQVLFAHCTVPRRAVGDYSLQTHFETGLGVALGGDFRPGPATVFKVGDPSLDRYFVSGAEILPGPPLPGLCRTQVRLRLQEPVDYFLKRSLANHHVLLSGEHVQLLDDFMRFSGAQRVD
jgi:L-fucose isomerase-like protein